MLETRRNKMKSFKSTLCAVLLAMALSSSAFAGNITGAPGNITGRNGNITGAPGNITGRAGNITGAPGNITGAPDPSDGMTAIDILGIMIWDILIP
jgi:hypothetical protein